jgi:hypothetical protein
LNGKCLLNIKLEEFGLKNFEHGLIIKLSSFIYKINNDINSPSILKNMIKRNNQENVIDLMLLESSFINFYIFVHTKNYDNFQLETDCFTYSENKLYIESTANHEICITKLEEIKNKVKSVLKK